MPDWDALGQVPAGTTGRRRIHPDTSHDLWYEIAPQTGRHRLRYETHATLQPIPAEVQTHSVRVLLEPRQTGHDLILELQDSLLADVFDVLIADVAAHIATTPGRSADPALELYARLGHWTEMLYRLASGAKMDPHQMRGLVGELLVLHDLLNRVSHDTAVASWTGPTRANQDFQLPQLAIEVKTTVAKNPQHLIVPNERELDPAGTAHLVLTRISLDEHAGGKGQTLHELIDQIRATVTGAPHAKAVFETRLRLLGWSEPAPAATPRLDEPRYTLRRLDRWEITGDFPRITETDLREGVGGVTYSITTTGLEQYEIDDHRFGDLLQGDDA